MYTDRVVLVIEDDDVDAMLINRMATMLGCRIVRAMTISESRTVLATSHVDVMIIDVKLPDGSGADFLESMRNVGNLIPALVMSSTDLKHIEKRVNSVEITRYIPKESPSVVIKQALQDMLEASAGITTIGDSTTVLRKFIDERQAQA